MGGVCACSDGQQDTAMAARPIEDRANIAGMRLFNENHVGDLYSMVNSKVDAANANVIYGQAVGTYKDFAKECVCKQQEDDEPGKPSIANGKVLLGPNCKLEVAMYLVQ